VTFTHTPANPHTCVSACAHPLTRTAHPTYTHKFYRADIHATDTHVWYVYAQGYMMVLDALGSTRDRSMAERCGQPLHFTTYRIP
jgi:hypothetical protein